MPRLRTFNKRKGKLSQSKKEYYENKRIQQSGLGDHTYFRKSPVEIRMESHMQDKTIEQIDSDIAETVIEMIQDDCPYNKGSNKVVEKAELHEFSFISQEEYASTEHEKDVDLSRFKLEAKKKLPSKRPHVPVEYVDTAAKKTANKLFEKTFTANQPKDWEEVLKNLREMRKDFDAPVDTMGCDQCPDNAASPEEKRFQALLSLMLSSQTKDQLTHAAMLRLREHGCSLSNILNTTDDKLGELIYPVSFWKTKVKNIKRTSEMIRDDFKGDIPNTVEGLCKLPGVGPKMAHLCMKTAWGEITGIGVDTHVHRICNRLQWVKTKTPEETRKQLEGWLPRDVWSEVNHLLVGFGQQICLSVKPKCDTCLNNQLCAFGIKELRTFKKLVKK
ncbi:hypothetical protein FQR65_LT13870 [Abscondita terminalis]|nr:hypothetical protein FQR65_LT13870 [Abscondita terminalis]